MNDQASEIQGVWLIQDRMCSEQRSLQPPSVMVWVGACATGKTPLVFVERSVKINSAVYQEMLKTILADDPRIFNKLE